MSSEPIRFKLELVGRSVQQLERLAALAEQRGIRPLLADAIRQLIDGLETHPREWGDPYLNYRGLKAVGYGKTILPADLRIEYAVHDTEPLVWVSRVSALPGSPLS